VVLLVGRTREDRRGVLGRFQYLDAHQRPVFLYLTARRRKVDVLRRAFTDRPDKPPAFLPEVHTWGDWRDRLSERFGDGRVPLPPVARELLMGRVWRAVRPRARCWGRLPDRPAVRRALADLVEAWEGHHAGDERAPLPSDPAALRLPGDPPTGLDPGAPAALRHDLALLVEGWRSALDRSPGWTDRPTAQRALLRALRDPPPSLLSSLRFGSLIVDDLIDLPPLERTLLSAFVDAFRRAAPEAPVHLCLEGPARGPGFFLSTDEADPGLRATLPLRASWASRLAEAGAPRDDAAEVVVADAEPARPDLADAAARDLRVDVASVVGGVRVRTYNDELAEVRAVARALKARLLAGARLDDHFVAFPNLDRYAPLVRDVLPAYGIPVRVERGDPLRSSPPVAAARALLAAAIDGTDRESLRSLPASEAVDALPPGRVRAAFARALGLLSPGARVSGPLEAALGRHDAGEVPPGDVELLRRAAVEAGADGPRPGAWVPALLTRVFARPPRDPAGWDRVVGLVECALRLDGRVRRLGGMRGAADLPDAARRFIELLDVFGLGPPDTVPEAPSPDAGPLAVAEIDAAHARVALHALLTTLHAQLGTVKSAVPDVQVSDVPDLFRAAFEQALDDAFVRPSARERGVQVVGLRDLHGVDVPWLWVGGLGEGEFPRAPRPSFLLPAAARRLLPEADRADEDRAVFASLLRNAGHGARRDEAVLILSHPRTTEGGDASPSPVLQDLIALRTPDGPLGDWFAATQADEEAALPPLLGMRELLSAPSEAERMPSALHPDVARETARQRVLARERGDPGGFGRFDGVVGLGASHRPRAVGWVRRMLDIGPDTGGRTRFTASASGLERWASCGIRWFFEQVLIADEPDPQEVEPSAAEQGSLLHAVLEALLAERIEGAARGRGPASLAGLDEEELAAVKTRAAQLVSTLAPSVVPARPGPWVDRAVRELKAGLEPDAPDAPGWDGPLAGFLDEAASPFVDLEPVGVEWRFSGLDPAEAARRIDDAEPTGEVKVALRGSVDRVDAGADGLGGARLGVFDYKSGRLSAPGGRVDRGLLLQPVVYAAAAARNFGPEAPPAGLITGYLEVREGVDSGRRFFLGDGSVLGAMQAGGRGGRALGTTSRTVTPQLWAAWLRRADLYGRWVADGVFPPTLAGPVHARCDRCPHRRACRVDHLRNADLARAAAVGGALLPAPVAASEHLEEGP